MKNFAVIGYGGQGAWHCDHLLKSDVGRLSGTFDINPKRNAAAADKGIFVYDSSEAIFADPAVDAVVIAVPNDDHKSLVIQALEAGKNVICEKPVEMSVAALDEMIAAANRTGKLFTVHQNRRFDVDFLAIKSLKESGEIGDFIRLESRIHGSRGIPSDWRCTKEKGGGMMLDWGVHLIDQILQLFAQKIIRVYCTMTHITNQEVDDGFRLELQFEDGCSAYVEVGTYQFIAMPRFYLQCKQGSALITDWREEAQVARLTAWNEKDVLPVQTAAGITKTMAPRDSLTLKEYRIPRPVSDVHDFYRNFVAALDGAADILVTHAEMRRVMQVMEAAFASDRRHQALETEI